MKVNLLSIEGKSKGKIELPRCFSEEIREDIVSRVLEIKKRKQPFSPSPVAGKQSSASGKIIHRRHVWKSQYGRGISRIPRKIMSKRGSQFNWEGATIPSTKGGRRAHPPKILSMIDTKRINKKEKKIAFNSVISATADRELIKKRYEKLKNEKIDREFPLVIESKITSLKTKELISAIKKVLGEKLFKVAVRKKLIRSGKGKLRGRKYKKNRGVILITGKDERLKTNAFEIINMDNLNITDLSEGGLGRLAVYTENAIKELKEKEKNKK